MHRTKRDWLYKMAWFLFILIILYVLLLLKPFWAPILHVAMTILVPLLIGGFIAYILHPLVEFLHEKGLHRGIAICIIYFLFFGGIGYGIYRGLPLVIAQMTDLSEHIPQFADQYRDGVTYLQASMKHWPDGLQDQIDERIERFEWWLSKNVSNSINVLMKLVNYALALAVIPFISFYLLKDIEVVKKAAWAGVPKKWRRSVLRFIRDVDYSIGGYIRGQLLDCLIIGFLSFIAFAVLGIKYPILLGIIIGVTNVIPYFGPILGAIPVSVIAATISLKYVAYVIGIVFVLQFIESYILSPLIVGKSLHLHPLFIIMALIAGEEVAGVAGLILAVPALAILKVAAIHAKQHLLHLYRANQVDKVE
ncbi:AI-2E family transporter [Heyndrickxia acidiproducens]|uniref:AI-2E family transporter n=1 Tax=Heyndrickxia acidiproducens TaxID=1121084 RepID=UPI00035CFC14|nr:AI-2E family transporter [Heyndrickxia acidiproducens]